MSATKKLYVVHYSTTPMTDANDMADRLTKISGMEQFKLGSTRLELHTVEGLNCAVWEVSRVVSTPADLVVIFEGMGDGGDPAFRKLLIKHMAYWQSWAGELHSRTIHPLAEELYSVVYETILPIDRLLEKLAGKDTPPVDLVITRDGDHYKANGQFVRLSINGKGYSVKAAHDYPLVMTLTLPDGLRVQIQTSHGDPTAIESICTPSEGREPDHFAEWGNPVWLDEVTIPANHPARGCFILSDEPYY